MKKNLAQHRAIMKSEIPNFYNISFSAQTDGYVCIHGPTDSARATDCIAKLKECKRNSTLKTFCNTWRPLFEKNGRRIQPSTLCRWMSGTIQPDVISCDCIEAVYTIMKSAEEKKVV